MKKIVIALFIYVEIATVFLMYMEATELSRFRKSWEWLQVRREKERLIMLSSRSVRSLDIRRI